MQFFAYIKCSFISFLRSHLYLCNAYVLCVISELEKSTAFVFYLITKQQAPLKYSLIFVNN